MPYNGGYTVGNTSTPPNRTRVNTLQWRIRGGKCLHPSQQNQGQHPTMEDTRWEMPPPLPTELGSTPYNGTYRGTVLLEVLSSFIRFWAVLVPKSCTSPHIIAMHPNQYKFHIHYSYHNVSELVVLISTFIIIISWLFHSP
jgi:hypothetical protein